MRKILLFSFLLFQCFGSSAQEFKVDASYVYLYSTQLDKAIQSYNFTRPIFTEKQPLLTHGLNVSATCIFRNDKHFKQGINFSFAYFWSWAENKNFSNQLNLHVANLGYLLHYENPEKFKGFYSDLIVSATSSLLYRVLNDEPFVYDETLSKSFGIGGAVQVKFGNSFQLNNTCYLSPFLSFAYTPYLFSPNNEAVINQTKGLVCKNWTEILTAQFGLTFHVKK
jgi:hypothetical protein